MNNRISYSIAGAAAALFFLAAAIPSTAAALAISALVAAIAFLRPKEGLLAILIYFPMRSFLTEMSPGLKLAGDLIIIAMTLRVLWNTRHDIRSWFRFHAFEYGFFAFLLIGSVSAFFTGVELGAIIFQLRAFIITYLVYYSARRLDLTKDDIISFLWVTVAVAMLMVVQGFVEKLSARTLMMPEAWVNRSLSPNNRVRIYGWINNPNVFAVYLTIAFICILYLRSLVTARWLKIVLFISAVLMMGIWFLTYSRGTWIGFAVGFVVFVALSRNWRSALMAIATIALGAALVGVPVASAARYIEANVINEAPPAVEAPDDNGEEEPEDSVEANRLKETFKADTVELSQQTGRLFVVTKGLEIFKDSPVIGTGFATFGDSATKSYSSPIYEKYEIPENMYSDSQYVQVIAQTGALGVIAFAVFLLGMLVLLWKKKDDHPFAIPTLSFLLGIFVCGLLYNIWEDKTFTTYFFLATAIVASTKNHWEAALFPKRFK
ncbi:O-antigen ligase family protein [Domibacillus indicus]|uniref:O-antigen ligase family protein n=1 Tax=Domibacillus indicus TaxID=1437523 RepID=UPI00061811F6|nr:O-antigen ligase family protein [Domibacillus indicus]